MRCSPEVQDQQVGALVELLREEGWITWRTGIKNVVALRAGSRPRYIEVATGGTPLARFTPSNERRLIDLADAAGAVPELAWWPSTRPTPFWVKRELWRR